jgi:glycosyltransferase involved in cell wall biosynthesis
MPSAARPDRCEETPALAPTPGEALRVVALIDAIQVSGPGRQLAALARCLAPRGVDLRVVTFHRTGRPRAPYLDHLERANIGYVVLPESGPLDARLIARLRRVLADWAPSIVQTHGYKPSALAYLLRVTGRGAGWRWIAFSHGTTSENLKTRFYHWLDARLMARADRVVAMSRRHQAGLSHLGAKACVVYNAVLPAPAENGRAAVSLPAELEAIARPVLGVVGRLSPEKGVDVFLHACERLARRDVAFSAVVAGDGPQRGDLERLRDGLGLRARVQFVGALSPVDSLYPRLDLLVIPSRSEGLPNVLLEALRANVPVVATRVGAVPEVIDSPRAGTLVLPEAPEALADAIERSLARDDDAEATAARRAVTERFSLERRVLAHVELYTDVLRRPEAM